MTTNREHPTDPDHPSLARWLEQLRFGHRELTLAHKVVIAGLHEACCDAGQVAAFRAKHPKAERVAVHRLMHGGRPYELLIRGLGTRDAQPEWITDGYAGGDPRRSYCAYGPLAGAIEADRDDYRRRNRWSA